VIKTKEFNRIGRIIIDKQDNLLEKIFVYLARKSGFG
jgi:hypothetical protein